MTFAFNPDDGPPRLFRYVDHGTLPGQDLLAIYDKASNLLIIDRELFAELPELDRHMLLRTQRPCTYLERQENRLAKVIDTTRAA